jgi:hypothetical protein
VAKRESHHVRASSWRRKIDSGKVAAIRTLRLSSTTPSASSAACCFSPILRTNALEQLTQHRHLCALSIEDLIVTVALPLGQAGEDRLGE